MFLTFLVINTVTCVNLYNIKSFNVALAQCLIQSIIFLLRFTNHVSQAWQRASPLSAQRRGYK